MENRIQYILLVASMVLVSILLPTSAIAAENNGEQTGSETEPQETQVWDEAAVIVEPEIERRKIDVAEIDAQDIQFGVFYGLMSVVDFGNNPVTGATFAYHVTEDIFVAASFGQTTTDQTSFEVISGAVLLTDAERDLTYYDLSVGLNLLPGEGFIGESFAFNSSFYGTLGVGSTEFAGDQRYTMSAAVGYRVVMQDWFAVHVEVKDLIYDIDILGTDKTTHNINFNIGFTVFF